MIWQRMHQDLRWPRSSRVIGQPRGLASLQRKANRDWLLARQRHDSHRLGARDHIEGAFGFQLLTRWRELHFVFVGALDEAAVPSCSRRR